MKKLMPESLHYFYLLLALISCHFSCSHSLNFSTTSIRSSPICLSYQSAALLQLKQESSFSHSKILEKWNHTRDCCSWDGVTCNARNGKVVGLDLSSSGIHGPLSPNSSLFKLVYLRTLNLAFNNFSFSAIPSRFGQLSSLTHLNLSCSLFSEKVPPEFSLLTELVSLDLSAYHDGSYPLAADLTRLFQNLTNLRVLHLDGVTTFSSSMPKSLVNLSSLTFLSLRGCYWDGEFPDYIFNLPKIEAISMSRFDSFSSGSLPEFQTDSKLKSLDMSFNYYLSGKLPDSIGNLKSLTVLNLGSCYLSGTIPSSIGNLSQLKHLDLSLNSFDGPLPFTIGNLEKLIILRLSTNAFEGDLSHSLRNLTQLEELDLSFYKFNGQILNLVTNLVKLKKLLLGFGSFIGQIPSSLGNLTHLEDLDLSENGFSGHIPTSLGHLTSLKQLTLSWNRFNGVIPSSLDNLVNLELLDLSWNSFSGHIPTSLGHLTSLKQLTLSRNRFNGVIPSSLSNLVNLERLDLSGNSFRGHIPFSLTNLTRLEFLDLSKNSFSGEIPSTFGNLKQLGDLRLSYNVFTGKLPVILSNLTQLAHMDLSCNQLTNLFDPSNSLEKFTALTFLDLSNNSIVGVIPSSIFRIPTLLDLHLDQNQLTSLDNHNISSSQLQLLDLRYNNLSIEFSIFSHLSHLKYLYLTSNNLLMLNEGVNFTFPKFYELDLSSLNLRQFPDFLKTQDKLGYLDLSSNKIEGKIPNWFWTIGNGFMTELYVSSNLISGWEESSSVIPSETGRLLYLHANKLTGRVDPILCKIGLIVLDLSKNRLNGTIPQCLGNSSSLVVLHLQDNNFQGNLSNNMFTEYGCQMFRALDLSHNHLQGKVPQSLITCRYLEVLNLGYNQMNDVFPLWLQNLPYLKVLKLGSNKLHGPLWSPNKSLGFAELQILDLSFNHFSGFLPSEYFMNWTTMAKVPTNQEQDGTFLDSYVPGKRDILYNEPVTLIIKGNDLAYSKISPILVSIDLSYNRFHGEIPSSLGDLRLLVALNLSSNNFRGHIPSLLGKLKELESLDLSKNNLSGRIPQQLTELTFLQYLNLSENQLTGPIPQERQFSTFLNSSFEGNSGLCGPPLSKKCGDHESPPPSYQSHESESELGFGWKAVAIGYGCGLVIGLITGYVVISRRPNWLVRTFGGFILR